MKLAIFDIDGTLIRSFMDDPLPAGAADADRAEHYAHVDVLPGRRERLGELRGQGVRIALATNQGGVACGYQTLEQVHSKLRTILRELRLGTGFVPATQVTRAADELLVFGTFSTVHVAYAHPKPRVPGWERYAAAASFWRKPGPGLLLAAMLRHRVPPAETVFVGDMDTDEGAAIQAGVNYVPADLFFDRHA